MATTFVNTVTKEIGTRSVEVYSTGPTTRATIVGLSLTNLTQSFVYVSVLLKDSTSVEGFYLKDAILPANTSLRVVNQGEKLILAPDNILSIQSSLADSVDCVLSYVEIT